MSPKFHFVPEKVATYAADKSTIRFQLPLAGSKEIPSAHFELKPDFTHDSYDDKKSVYFIQQTSSDVSYRHRHLVGRLLLKLFG